MDQTEVTMLCILVQLVFLKLQLQSLVVGFIISPIQHWRTYHSSSAGPAPKSTWRPWTDIIKKSQT